MIQDVDEAIRSLIREEALAGAQVDVVFDAPTKEWSSRRNAPTLDVYLYDIREDLRRREVGRINVHDDAGRITGRRRPPRHFKLSYLVTAWTQRPEDEHRLLAAVLACFARHDALPEAVLQGTLADTGLPVPVTVALPPPEDRALSDTWSALGGELKPSLDLVITIPLDAEAFEPAAALVTELPRVSIGAAGRPGRSRDRAAPGGSARSSGPAGDTAGPSGPAGDTAGPSGPAGSDPGSPAGDRPAGGRAPATAPPPGRGTEAAGRRGRRGPAGRETGAAGAGGVTEGAPGGVSPDADAGAAEETVTGGDPGGPGRVYHWRTIAER